MIPTDYDHMSEKEILEQITILYIILNKKREEKENEHRDNECEDVIATDRLL
jgi:hypothetical protein